MGIRSIGHGMTSSAHDVSSTAEIPPALAGAVEAEIRGRRTKRAQEAMRIDASKFDQLLATATPLILAGGHRRDTPPVEGGRWPVSAVFRPRPRSVVGQRLDELTAEAARLAGAGHWQTGQAGSAHLTIRALEWYRKHVPASDQAVHRYQAALETTAAKVGPVGFEVTGLTLTPGTVMACAQPLDDRPEQFLDLFAEVLGNDAWLERDHFSRRDIWYINLLHFTTRIEQPDALVDWVAARRTQAVGRIDVTCAELIRFRLRANDRPAMWPEVLGTARLAKP